MKAILQHKRARGFSLIETVAATAFSAVALTALMGYLIMAQRTRIQFEARRQAIFAANTRADMFADGLLYPEAYGLSAGSVLTVSPALTDLPGGFPLREHVEKVTLLDARTAQLEITMSVETARQTPAVVVVRANRYR